MAASQKEILAPGATIRDNTVPSKFMKHITVINQRSMIDPVSPYSIRDMDDSNFGNSSQTLPKAKIINVQY